MLFAEVGTGAVLILGLLAVFLLTRTRRGGARAEAFHPTNRVVVDQATGRRARLYVDPDTGEEQYREEPPDPAP